MKWLKVLLICSSVLGVLGGEDCDQDAAPLYSSGCCSKAETIMSETFRTNAFPCLAKFFPAESDTSSDTTPTPFLVALKDNLDCVKECVFTENKLLDDAKQLLGEPVTAALTSSVDEELKSTVTAAIEHCLGSYKDAVDPDAECSSGSAQFLTCLSKEVLLNCPATLATGDTCEEAKKQLEKCPNSTVFLFPPSGQMTFDPVPVPVPADA